MKKTIFCLSLLAAFCSNAASVHDELKPLSTPKMFACYEQIQKTKDSVPETIHDLKTILDYGNRFYIISNPEHQEITVLSPKLSYTEEYGPPSATGNKENVLFIKGVGKTKGIYRLFFRDDKSMFTYLCT